MGGERFKDDLPTHRRPQLARTLGNRRVPCGPNERMDSFTVAGGCTTDSALARGRRELADLEALWRSGHPDKRGIRLAISDWMLEEAILLDEKRVRVFNTLSQDSTDFYGTPDYAMDLLIKYIPETATIWEPCAGFGRIVKYLWGRGFQVIGTDLVDGLNALDEVPQTPFDIIVTNPPYSLKTEFLERCYLLGKPFALLMPSDLVNKRRTQLMRTFGTQLIVPSKRIRFIRFSNGVEQEASSPNMGTIWYTWGLKLPQDLMFVDAWW